MALAPFIDAEREHLLRRHEGVMLAMRGFESLGAKDIDDHDIAALYDLVERLGTDIHKSMTSLAAFIEMLDAIPKQPKKEEEKAK